MLLRAVIEVKKPIYHHEKRYLKTTERYYNGYSPADSQ